MEGLLSIIVSVVTLIGKLPQKTLCFIGVHKWEKKSFSYSFGPDESHYSSWKKCARCSKGVGTKDPTGR